jgi:hypothetical protein
MFAQPRPNHKKVAILMKEHAGSSQFYILRILLVFDDAEAIVHQLLFVQTFED